MPQSAPPLRALKVRNLAARAGENRFGSRTFDSSGNGSE